MRYVILGMHKSGTTLLSHMLHDSGVNMVDNTVPLDYDQGSKYERMSFVLTNLALLDINPSKLSFETNELRSSPKALKELIDYHADHLISKNNEAYEIWGFKDPRTCLTYNYWNKKLGTHKLIGVYRNPFEVLNHYTRKYKFGSYRPILVCKILRSWFVYNSAMLQAIGSKSGVLISYNWLIEEPKSINTLSKYLSLNLIDLRNFDLKRSENYTSVFTLLMLLVLRTCFKVDIKNLMSDLKNQQSFNKNK